MIDEENLAKPCESTPNILLFKGHKAPVISLTTHPLEISLFASGSEDCTVRLWDRRDKSAVKCFLGSNFPISALTFDSKFPYNIYSIMNRNEVKIFDIRKDDVVDSFPVGSLNFDLSEDYEANSLSIQSKDRYLAIADDSKLTVFDLTSKRSKIYTRLHTNVISKVLFKPNSVGEVASCGFDYLFNLWDYRTGRSKYTVDFSQNIPKRDLKLTNPPFVHDFTFLKNSKYIACALGDGSISILNSYDGSIILNKELHKSMISNIDSNFKNTIITGGVDGNLQINDLVEENLIHDDAGKSKIKTNRSTMNLNSKTMIHHKSKINCIACSKIQSDVSFFLVADLSNDVSLIELSQ